MRCVLWRTDNVKGQIYKHISVPNIGYWVYYPSNNIETHGKNVYEQRAVLCMGCLHSLVFSSTTSWTNKHVPSSVTTAKLSFTLNSILYRCFNCKRCTFWELGCILEYFPF